MSGTEGVDYPENGDDASPNTGNQDADLPVLLFVRDLARGLHVSEGGARKMILRGECGPYSRMGRRLVVRREAFLEALEAREKHPKPASGGSPRSRPDREFLRKLKRGQRPLPRSSGRIAASEPDAGKGPE